MSLVKFQIINNSWLPVWWGLKRLNLDQVQGQEQGQDLLFPIMKEILKLLHFYIRIYCCCSVCHTSVPLLFFFYPAKNKNISSNTLIYHLGWSGPLDKLISTKWHVASCTLTHWNSTILSDLYILTYIFMYYPTNSIITTTTKRETAFIFIPAYRNWILWETSLLRFIPFCCSSAIVW